MITLDHVSKSYRTKTGRRVVLDDVNVEFPTGANIGILGTNGTGKSTLVRILAGTETPDSGRVRRDVQVSFPMGFTGSFQGNLSARENITFIARIYGMPIHETIEFVRDFAELGDYFDMPVRTYSAGMRARLSFGVSLAIDFDVYLIDELTEVGDARFRTKARAAFRARVDQSSVIIVSHSYHTIREYCDFAAVMNQGAITLFPNLEDAVVHYEQIRTTQ